MLSRWSEEWLSSADPAQLDAEIVRDRWLGFAPATAATLAAAEARIGRTLPPSYREFLLTTDGWRHAGCFVWRMRDTTNLGWLRLFLDPGDVDDAGEWAAYSLFSWHAAPPTRYPSFTPLMDSLYAQFHQMRRPEGETRDGWDARVDQARLDVLAGDIDGAAAVLAQAAEFGRVRATVLRVQLLLLLGERHEASQLLGRLLHPSFLPEGFLTDPLFTDEFLPLLFAEHAQDARPNHNSTLQSAMIGDRPDIQLAIGEYQAMLRRPGHRLNYGNAAFDNLIQQALAEHATDPDALWGAVRAALPHWRPRTTDHLGPVVLLADPVLVAALTPERGRELLCQPRGDR